jgi:hypothetical protein
MTTISPYNNWLVQRELTLVTNNQTAPLVGAVVQAAVYADLAATQPLAITPIDMVMGFPGFYSGSFDQLEVDIALNLILANAVTLPSSPIDIYEVVTTQDGSYRDVAKLRVVAARFVAPGPQPT